jgi:hypothetical protein
MLDAFTIASERSGTIEFVDGFVEFLMRPSRLMLHRRTS